MYQLCAYGVNLFSCSYSFCCIVCHMNFIIAYSGIADTLLVPATYEPLHKDGGATNFKVHMHVYYAG